MQHRLARNSEATCADVCLDVSNKQLYCKPHDIIVNMMSEFKLEIKVAPLRGSFPVRQWQGTLQAVGERVKNNVRAVSRMNVLCIFIAMMKEHESGAVRTTFEKFK